MKLLNHQIKYAQHYKDKELVVWETGTGKTVGACVWQKDGRDVDSLVVSPKRVIKKWGVELTKWGTKATIVSKEQLKKEDWIRRKKWSSITVDEADEFASPLFTKGRSKLSEAMYELIQNNQETPILLLSATPIRSNPWNLHTLLTFKGYYIDWKKWREAFFKLERRPYLPHPAWLPRYDWRQRIRPVLERNSDIVLMKDCVGELPAETTEHIEVTCDPFQFDDEWSPSAAFVAEHRNEQEYKPAKILDIGKGYRKVLVVAHYREQCIELERILSKDRTTYMVMGGVKDQEKILKEANECDECYLIVQASLNAGFDLDSFSICIFASMSYSVRDWIQMKGRIRRIHNLHPVNYTYLVAGRCDEAVIENILLGKEFVPATWTPKTYGI